MGPARVTLGVSESSYDGVLVVSMMRRLLSSSIWFLLVATSAAAQPASRRATGPYTTVELIAADAAAAPGADLWVGLQFQLDPGWHIYWQNPGDSGNPPSLRWQLPAGFLAGDIAWPAPERIPAGSLVNYGYEGGVVLPVPIRAAPGVKTGLPATIGLDVKWLVCQELCVPGQARLELRLPLAAPDRAQVAGWAHLIEEARARVPKPAPAAWMARAVSQKDAFVVTVETGARETQAVFFPLEVGRINDSALQQIRALPRGLELTLRKSDQLRTDPAELTGVLALSAERTYVIVAPIAGGRAPEQSAAVRYGKSPPRAR